MTRPPITHVLRAPIIGGSELETLAIVSTLPGFDHRIVFPARFAGWEPSIRPRFPVPVEAVPDLQRHLDGISRGIVHLQFPFVRVDSPAGHDSVLELRQLPGVPTVFTVHAAVNVPVVPDVHYVFHTHDLAARFASRIPSARRSVCPSLVPLPPPPRPRPTDGLRRVLWVSRNEGAKFHPELGTIVASALAVRPHLRFRFVGHCEHVRLPEDERVEVIACPAPDLAAEWAAADVFWYFPHPLLEETWCRTVTEAMAHGLPCVVAAHGAMTEQVIDGVHGRVVGDPRACLQALLESADLDHAACRRVAAENRARAADFARTSTAHWRDLYARLIADCSA
ncbi:MAG: glycosyltransferase [Planctomycetota bacterium]